jgi:prephenate dehydratase
MLVKIATLGPRGTYSEEASRRYAQRFGRTSPEIEFTTVERSLRYVEERMVDVAIIPVENMVDGVVGSTLDALIEHHDFVKVCDEVNIRIRHVLAASSNIPLEDIRKVYSHSSALSQCSGTLSNLMPAAILVPVGSTGEAAEMVKNCGEYGSAAICSHQAAREYGLAILDENIQDYIENMTRFMVCALTDSPYTGSDKTLMAIRPGRDKPGILYELLKGLAEARVNLTFIQSRPYKIRPNEYVFVVEMDGHKVLPNIKGALLDIDRQVREDDGWKKVLGSYPRRGLEE